MSLTKKFNLKAKAKRRTETETDTFGGRSLSRYFSTVAFGKRHGRKVQIEILQVKITPPGARRARRCRGCEPMKIEKVGKLGENVEGVIVEPQHVSVVGLVDAAAGYLIGVRVAFDADDPLTIMLPLDFVPTFIRLLQEQSDEMRAMQTAPRS